MVDKDDHGSSPGLAERAGPVRTWLTRYFGRRVHNAADVEDMVQDVFVRIAARDGAQPIRHLDGYVLRIASNVLADRGRSRAVRRADVHVLLDPDQHGEAALDPARIYAGREDLHAAIRALLELPERTRTVFVLRRLEGCSVRDVAVQLGLSVSAVEKHLLRAVRHLGAAMETRDGA